MSVLFLLQKFTVVAIQYTCMAVSGSVRSPVALAKFHDFGVEDVYGNNFTLHRYTGKILLIVNIASFGEKSVVVLRQMNDLQSKYSDHLAVLGFPCNQFDHSVSICIYEHAIYNGGLFLPRSLYVLKVHCLLYIKTRLQEHGKGEEILNTMRFVRPGNDFNPSFALFDRVRHFYLINFLFSQTATV